ncbi:hypothetical protein RIF29_42494 [Crotalaria pallida]|uniref:Reverse transcriptase n=1 Tax=Crotalaria pallida TaxID=3830 RepID=A0AAN9HWD7_CROPI
MALRISCSTSFNFNFYFNFKSTSSSKFSASFPTPNSTFTTLRATLCRATNSHSHHNKPSSSSATTKKKKKNKTNNNNNNDGGDSDTFNIVADFEIVQDFPAGVVDVRHENEAADYSSLRNPNSMALPEPPAGFILDDHANVVFASSDRLLTIVDPTNNLPLECVVRRVFRSSEGHECMLLCPVDTPVQILKSTNEDGWSAVSDKEVESILPAAAYALAKIHMHLVYNTVIQHEVVFATQKKTFLTLTQRIETLESSMELMKKTTSEQGLQLRSLELSVFEIKKNMDGIQGIKRLISSWMRKQGIDPEEDEDESRSDHNEESTKEQSSKAGGDSDSENSKERSKLSWAKKVELPCFDGTDPMGWVARAEKFFEVHQTKDSEKVQIAFVSMEGTAIHWFRFLRKKAPELSWEKLVEAMVQRFGGRHLGNVYERLTTLRQTGDIEEFVQEFEVLVAQASEVTEEQLLGYFLGGLRAEVRCRVRTHDPKEITQAMILARDVEEELRSSRVLGGPNSRTSTPSYRATFSGGVVSRLGSQPVGLPAGTNQSERQLSQDSTARSGVNQPRNRGAKHLPYQEYLKRREAGRCFRCGGQFGPGHRCPEKSLRITILAEDEMLNEEGEIVALQVHGEGELEDFDSPDMSCQMLNLSLFSAGGLTQPKTMKLYGLLHDVPVLVLIDSGASHNFIAHSLVKRMGLPVAATPAFAVRLGDGYRKDSQGCCKDLELVLAEHKVNSDFYLFDLGGVDVILGVAWLETLGDVKVNWRNLTMSFVHSGKNITVQGDPSLSKTLISSRSLLKVKEVEFASVLLCVVDREDGERQSSFFAKQDSQLQKLLDQFKHVFAVPTGLPPVRDNDHRIPLKSGTDPINVRPYRYPHVQKNEMEKLVEEMLKSGIIRPSTSPFSSPVILIKKKDGSWRFCVDYRALNKATIPDKFPIPVIEELLDELYGATFFSKIDLRASYHQIRMFEEDIQKTAFRTHQGHYEFLVMPFGLTNAPATFQSAMNSTLKPFLRKFVLVFFDDILIYSRTWEEHLTHLQQVLETLEQHQFFANQKKCIFGQTMVEYLGHIISKEGVAMDQKKVQSILQWPIPKTVKALRGFLGLTGYYRRFIKNYGKIVRPLTELLKKGKFAWNSPAEEAFQKLQQMVTSAPVLAMPDFSKPFVIECDASGKGLGAVLSQEKRPIAFFSKALSDSTLAKSVYEKELMALVLAIQHWRPYLLGRRFTVYTDQKSLRYLLEQRITTHEQQNWLAKLLGYEFDIVYKVGSTNKVADALSRKEEDRELQAISRPIWQDIDIIDEEVRKDPVLEKIREDLVKDANSHPYYTLEGDKLYYKGRLVLSSTSTWISKLFQEFHSTPTGGHSGVYRTYRRMAQSLFWIGMKGAIATMVEACHICQRSKYQASTPAGLLQPLPIPNAIWEEISMDFIVGLPKSKGFDAVLVVVDRLSKYGHFIALRHPYTARTVAEQFIKEVVRLHGIPISIVSDRDSTFMSSFWQELFRLQGTQLKMSTAYHPETDGQTEVLNRTLETYLRCFVSEQPKGWHSYLSWAEYWYNTSFHTAAQKTPFEIVYGRPPPALTKFIPGETLVEAVAQDLMDRDEILKQLKFHLSRAQDHMTKFADRKRRPSLIQPGDWVYLKIRPHRQGSMPTRLHPKLAARYYGPYLVLKQVGAVAFKLQLPECARIHPVFHVSQFKRAVGGHVVEPELPKELEVDAALYQPESVLASRTITQHGEQIEQVLIKWQSKPAEEATWEDILLIKSQFPEFNLEDKVDVQGGSIVRAQTDGVWKVYEDTRYMIYTPSDPLLFVGVKDQNGMLQVADDELLEDPAIYDAIDEETEFNALAEEEAALLDLTLSERL